MKSNRVAKIVSFVEVDRASAHAQLPAGVYAIVVCASSPISDLSVLVQETHLSMTDTDEYEYTVLPLDAFRGPAFCVQNVTEAAADPSVQDISTLFVVKPFHTWADLF